MPLSQPTPVFRPGKLFPVLTTATVCLGAVLLLLELGEWGPAALIGTGWLGKVGAVAVGTAYAALLAARTGARAAVVAPIALLIGLLGVGVDPLIPGDQGFLAAGAAVLTAVVTGVLAVLVTQPARRIRDTALELVIAYFVATVGALAVVGFEPSMQVVRFEYLVLALSGLFGVAIIYQLGAGLHGLGTRGLMMVIVGTLVLALCLTYLELLRRYGNTSLTGAALSPVEWMRETLGGNPRPLQALVGIPALLWGVHMRARRRQGWWVCAFGVAGTASVACNLIYPGRSVAEITLSELYTFVIGALIGFALIRLDLLFTAPKGRRGRRTEESTATRPEPTRFQPLL